MRVGERFKDHKTGRVYTVKRVGADEGIVLKEANSSERIVVGQIRKAKQLARGLFSLPFCILRPPAGGAAC